MDTGVQPFFTSIGVSGGLQWPAFPYFSKANSISIQRVVINGTEPRLAELGSRATVQTWVSAFPNRF